MSTAEICDAFGIDTLCERIVDGASLTLLSKEIGVSKGSLLTWIAADSDRSARVAAARELAADSFADLAQERLESAKATKVEIARAKELAHHFRWKASMANPRRFGTKVELNATLGVHTLKDDELDAREVELQRQIDQANEKLMRAGIALVESAPSEPESGE